MNSPIFSLHQNAEDPDAISYFATTDTRGKHVPFGIKQHDRSKHTYVIGKSGMGKSTLLENMAAQDIQSGRGMCFIDPHGASAERLMEYIPAERVKDVLYFAPFDLQYPISFNVLESVDADKRHLVVAGLMSAFEKIWVDAWSARMAYILQNTIAALLEFPGATLLGVNRMYIDKEYRKNVIASVTDPSVRSFWVDEFSKYTDRYAQEATPAIQNKIGQFASNALVRNVIGQQESSFNIRHLMDERKIFIVNLSKGRVGEGNANLLGSMLITKIYLAAMSRADVGAGEQKNLAPFFLYVDEFQNFANKSFAEILSEARKYKLSLTIAHQYIEQMEEEVRAAVFGNVGTMISFRVGAYDAEVLEKEYAPTFEMDDLVNLGARQIYLKLMIDNVSSQPFSAATLPPVPEPEVPQTDRAIAFSRARYSRPRAEVEKTIEDWSKKVFEDPEAEEKEKARLARRAAREAEENRPPSERMPRTAPARADGGRPPRPREREQTRGRDGGGSRERTERPAPRERREGGSASRETERRPQPPRAPAPKQEPKEDLKQFLGALKERSGAVDATSPQPQQRSESNHSTPTSSTHVTTPPSNTPRPVSTAATQQQAKQVPEAARDDGKGISPEGREALRNLLLKVRETSARQSDAETPRPARAQPQQKRPQQQEHKQREQENVQSPQQVPQASPQQSAPSSTPVHETHVPIQNTNTEPRKAVEQHTTHVPVTDATPHTATPAKPASHTTHVPVDDATPHSAQKVAHETHVPVTDANPHTSQQQAEQVAVTHKFVKVEVPKQTPPKAQAHTRATHVPVEDANPHEPPQKPHDGAQHTTHVPVTDVTPHSVPVEQSTPAQHSAAPKAPGIPVDELRRRLHVEKPDV